jgi:esterase/lipase
MLRYKTLLTNNVKTPYVRHVQTLSHEFISDPASSKEKTLLLLHGLLGNRRNMKSFANLIAKTHPDWQVLLMDVRGHGSSTSMPDADLEHGTESTLLAAAEDVAYTCFNLGIPPPNMVCGHSMGGKVALSYLQGILTSDFDKYFGLYGNSASFPQDLWLMDSIPSLVSRTKNIQDKESVASVLENVAKVKMPVKTKQDLIDSLLALGTSMPTAQWMTTNLAKSKSSSDSFQFIFDLPTCLALYRDYSVVDFMPLLCGEAEEYAHNTCTINVVIAGRNQYSWDKQVVDCLTSRAQAEATDRGSDALLTLNILPKSGHNIHIDDPTGMVSLMEYSLTK